MKTARTLCATLVAVLALAVLPSETFAQARRSSSPSRTTTSRPAVSKPEDRKVKPSARPVKVERSTSSKRTVPRSYQPSGRKPGTEVKKPSVTPDNKPSNSHKRDNYRPDNHRPDNKPGNHHHDGYRPDNHRPDNKPGNHHHDGYRPDNRRPDGHHKKHQHPRERGFLDFAAPSYYWAGHNHCYGHRVKILPSYVSCHVHHGVTYYYYNDIWYRPYGEYYVVCRPPMGTTLADAVVADMVWTAVNLSYYYTIANTYSQINENNAYIAQQNEIIAQNNMIIAAQNEAIAMNEDKALAAYTLANQLGLVQSYAAAATEYFYQDGVFYVKNASGECSVIIPPAGAVVESLSEDYDMVTLSDGNEYYQVDNTIYRIIIVDGKPYFEVLGQLYK